MKYLFVDTNLFLQCRDLSDLPWKDLSDGSDIELIIPRAVQEEIDKLKNDGNNRRAKRARNANSYLRRIVTSDDERLTICARSPRVELTCVPSLEPNKNNDQRVVLDPTRADDSIILEMLAYCDAYPDRFIALLTNDTNPMLTAKRAGLAFIEIPETWLLGPEPDDRDKKLRALEARLTELEKSHPEIQFGPIGDGTETTQISATITKYAPLAAECIDKLVEQIKAAYPMQTSFEEKPSSRYTGISGVAAAMADMYVSPTEIEIKKYQEKEYPDWLSLVRHKLETFSELLETETHRIDFSFAIMNIGSVPAEHVIVRIEASHGLALPLLPDVGEDEDDTSDPLTFPRPPAAPRGTYRKWHSSGISDWMNRSGNSMDRLIRNLPPITANNQHSVKRDRHKFYWKDGRPDVAESIWELECEEFRHQVQTKEFDYQIMVVGKPTGGMLKCTVSAANLRKPAEKEIPIKLNYTDGDTLQEIRERWGLSI